MSAHAAPTHHDACVEPPVGYVSAIAVSAPTERGLALVEERAECFRGVGTLQVDTLGAHLTFERLPPTDDLKTQKGRPMAIAVPA